jgi:hypothetical protein
MSTSGDRNEKRNEKKKNKAAEVPADPSTERFVQDVLVRGEAEKPGPDGKLGKDATHAIVEENPDGTAKIERARFKTF